jgi:hypothetical protein
MSSSAGRIPELVDQLGLLVGICCRLTFPELGV